MVTLMTVLIGIAVLIVLRSRFVSACGAWEGDPAGATVERWRRRRDGLTKTLTDLALDREAGRISPEDFESLRRPFERRLAETDRMVGGLRQARYQILAGGGEGPSRRMSPVGTAARARVEALVRERRARVPRSAPSGEPAHG